MRFHRIVAAVDNSHTSWHAAKVAALIASRVGAELTVLTVGTEPRAGAASQGSISESGPRKDLWGFNGISDQVHSMVVDGLPQVEVGRFAESIHADLIVLGRKARSRAARPFLGDTADAVIRRSRLPCLLVPGDLEKMERIGAALDGTDRGLVVFRFAEALSTALNLPLVGITVEPAWPGEPAALATALPSGRSERLAEMMEESASRTANGRENIATAEPVLRVRRGEVVEALVQEAVEQQLDILVTGFHRGGPPMVFDKGGVCRRLLHAAPCAALTVPL